MEKVKIKIVPFNDPSVAKVIKDRFNDSKSYRQQWEGQWKVNEMNLYNSKGTLNTSDIETGATSIAASIRSLGNNSGTGGEDTDIGFNYVMRNHRLLHSQMSANPPVVHARPATSDTEDQRRTEAANDVLKHGLRRYQMQNTIDLATNSGLSLGMGYILTLWNPLLGDIKSYDESTGEVEMQGDIEIYSPSTWDIWLDSKAKRVQEMRYFIEKLVLPEDLAQAMFPKHFENLKDQESANKSGFRSWDSRRRDADSNTEDQVTVYRYYEKGLPINAMQGRFCFLDQEGTVIGEIKHNPYQFKVTAKASKNDIESLPSAQLPIHIFGDIDVSSQLYCKSFIEYACLAQDQMNRLDSTRLDLAKAHGIPRMVVSEDANLNDDDVTTSVWDIMRVSSNQPPYFVPPAPAMGDANQLREMFKMGIDDMCGVNESMFGQTSRETSGFSMQYATNQGNMIRQRLFNKYVLFVEQVYKFYLNLCIKNWTVPQTVSVLGNEGAFNIIDIKGSDIDSGYDVVVEYGNNFSLDPVLRREEIMNLMPSLKEAGMTPKEILRMLRVGDVETGMDNMELGRRRQEEIFRIMIETHQYIKPRKLQDHQAYLDYAYMYVNTAEYRDLEEIEQKLIDKHITDREELAASKAAPATPADAGGAPPMGGGMPPMGGGGMPPMPMG